MRPIFLPPASSSSFFRFICQPHLLHPHTIYCFAGTVCHSQVLLLPSNSVSTAPILRLFTRLNCSATVDFGGRDFKLSEKQFKVYEGEKRKKKINFPSCINNNQNMFYIPLPPRLHFSSTALLSFILSAFKLCLHLLLNQYSKPFSSSSSFSSGRVRCQIGVTAGLALVTMHNR